LCRRWSALEPAQSIGVQRQYLLRPGRELDTRPLDDATLEQALLEFAGAILDDRLARPTDAHPSAVLIAAETSIVAMLPALCISRRDAGCRTTAT